MEENIIHLSSQFDPFYKTKQLWIEENWTDMSQIRKVNTNNWKTFDVIPIQGKKKSEQ